MGMRSGMSSSVFQPSGRTGLIPDAVIAEVRERTDIVQVIETTCSSSDREPITRGSVPSTKKRRHRSMSMPRGSFITALAAVRAAMYSSS